MSNFSFFWSIFGTLMFSLRIYLVELKLSGKFEKNKHLLSRLVNLLFWIFMIIQWDSNILAISIFISFPVMTFSFFYYDIKSIWTIVHARKDKNNKSNWYGELIERISIHLPISLAGIISILNQKLFFLNNLSSYELIILSLIHI